jgi:hypothetical protein
MSTFNQLAAALREDCDAPLLATATDLRRAGTHRTVVARAVGGAATLVVVAGVTTGAVVLSSSPTATVPGTSSTPAVIAASTATPSPVLTSRPVGPPAPVPSQVKTPATSTTTHHAPRPSTSSATEHTTPACSAGRFDVGHATISSDDAAGIIGYDIGVKYLGSSACILSQPPRVYYTTVQGETLPFAIDSAHSHPKTAKPLTVTAGRIISVTVYGVDGRNETPVPPNCSASHLYKGLAVSIDGHIGGLLDGSMTFPCSGPVSMAWTFAN